MSKKPTFAIIFALCCILNIEDTSVYGQANDSLVNWWEPSSYIAPETHWIEDASGIVCVTYDSSTNELHYGPCASHVKLKKWKVTLEPCDTTKFVLDERYCEGFWFGKFRKKKASKFVKDHFQCGYEYEDRTCKGLIWTMKIYSKTGELLEVKKRVLIGYYRKIFSQ